MLRVVQLVLVLAERIAELAMPPAFLIALTGWQRATVALAAELQAVAAVSDLAQPGWPERAAILASLPRHWHERSLRALIPLLNLASTQNARIERLVRHNPTRPA
jgi:hypothetical protein